MRRRSFIASTIAGIGAVSGCLSNGPTSPSTGSPTDAPQTDQPPSATESTATPTAGPTPTYDVTVESLQLQYGLVKPSSPDSIGIFDPEAPYLVASIRVDGPLSYDEFGLQMGDVWHSPTKPERLYRTSWGDDQWYEPGRTSGLMMFDAPKKPTEHLRMSWPGGEHPIDEAIVERLDGSPPKFSASIDVPSTHAGTNSPPVEIEVTNEGEQPGRFFGALNRTGPLIAYTPIARLSELVPAGDSTTIEIADGWGGTPAEDRIGDDETDVTYRLYYAGGEDSARIRLVEPS